MKYVLFNLENESGEWLNLLFLNICYFLETMQLQLERNFKWIKKKSDYEGFFGEGNGNPLHYSCLENPVDRGAWWAAGHRVAQSWTRLKWLSSSSSSMKVSWVALLKGVIELPGLVISTISMTYFIYMYCCLGTGDRHKSCSNFLVTSEFRSIPSLCSFHLQLYAWLMHVNQSILKEISPGCSLVGLMLKLKLQ